LNVEHARGRKGTDSVKNANEWLSYSIAPEQVQGVQWPAMWGNGQLEYRNE